MEYIILENCQMEYENIRKDGKLILRNEWNKNGFIKKWLLENLNLENEVGGIIMKFINYSIQRAARTFKGQEPFVNVYGLILGMIIGYLFWINTN